MINIALIGAINSINAANNKLLLDRFIGASIGLSLRKLKDDATYCIRARRDSDNAELDIGFDLSGALDASALNSFASGGNGYIVKIYDQSGNGRHAVANGPSSQPKIYDTATGLIIDQFTGMASARIEAAHYLDTPLFTDYMPLPNSFFMVNRILQNSANGFGNVTFVVGGNNSGFLGLYALSYLPGAPDQIAAQYRTLSNVVSVSANTANANTYLQSSIYNNEIKIRYNGGTDYLSGQISQGNYVVGDNIRISNSTSVGNGILYFSELIIYPFDMSGHQLAIESNINNYYQIY
jgi:hypothetical protein